MALEHSIFRGDELVLFVNTHYGLRITDLQKLKLGTANCYRLSDGERSYFLKEFQSGMEEATVRREADLVAFLAARGIPVAQFIPTSAGESITRCRGHLVCLQEFAEGTAYGYDDFPPSMLGEAARMLGKLHTAMCDIDLPFHMDEKWLNAYCAEEIAAQYDALLTVAEQRRDDPNRPRLLADLQYKKELSYRCADYRRCYSGVTYLPTHGDYQGCQLICRGESIVAITDFSSARTLPAVWEVMRSYVQSSHSCRRRAVIDLDGLCGYVREYLKFSPLTEQDARAMPYVYLFQLARSKYGYPQYLTSDSPDREGLLRFAFWRTEMCRHVEARAEEIAQAVTALLD